MTPLTLPIRSPAAGVAWHLWTRHRRGVLNSLATLAAAAVVYPRVFAWSHADWLVALSTLPLVSVFGGALSAFLIADDPANPSRGFPRRMFPLPVPTHVLVFWPMAIAAAVAAAGWVATACLVYRQSGFRTPVLLPALGMAAGVMWFQAFAWSPFARPTVRILATAFSAVTLGLLPVIPWGLQLGPRWVTTALVAAYLPAAYGLAWAGVATDRRGDSWQIVPRWVGFGWLLDRVVWRNSFAGLGEAQRAYEWRCHGVFLPGVTAMVAAALLLAAPVNRADPQLWRTTAVLEIALALLFYPAAMMGLNVAALKPFWVVRSGAETFVLTRPITTGAIVRAKFRTAWRSTLMSWAVMAAGLVLWVALAGAGDDVRELWRSTVGRPGGWRAWGTTALLVMTFLGVTWTLMTLFLPPALSGRAWISNLSMLILSVGIGAGGGARFWWEFAPAHRPLLLATIPWLVAGAAVLKAAAAAWGFRVALLRGSIGRSALGAAGAAWLGVFVCLALVVVELKPPGDVPLSLPVAVLATAVVAPLGRFALAPLALDLKRHG